MTNKQMKTALNAELKSAVLLNRIKEVTEIGVNTVLVFENELGDTTKQWLQNRFVNGVTFSDGTDKRICFINTPAQNNKQPKNRFKKVYMVMSLLEEGVPLSEHTTRYVWISTNEGTYDNINDAEARLQEMMEEESKNDSDLRFKIETVYSKF